MNSNSSETIEQFPSSMDLVSTPVLEGSAPLTSVVSSVEEVVSLGDDSKSSAASTGPVEEQAAEQSKRQLKKLKKREAWLSKKAERR